MSDARAPGPREPIPSHRLTLVVVPDAVLIAVAAANGKVVEWPEVGLLDHELCTTMPAARRLAQLADDPEAAPWLVRGIVITDPDSPTGSRVAGHLGGHGRPDADGMVEVGYTVRAADRGRGLATEAAAAWFAWAHEHGARTARLSIAPDNTASLAVARRLGLHEVGRVWDEDDARWEIVLEHPLPLASLPL